MLAMDSASTFDALSSLLDPTREKDEEEGVAANGGGAITPASFGAPQADAKSLNAAARRTMPQAKALKKHPNDIWDVEDLPDAVEDDYDDGRAVPKFEIMHRQAITTADAYLGIAYVHKDPGSVDCEEMTLKIDLPGVKAVSEIDLDVQPTYIRLSSEQYKLNMYLPAKVDEKKGSAKWDAKKERLDVVLPLVKEDLF